MASRHDGDDEDGEDDDDDDVVNIKLINNQVLQIAKVGFRCWHVSQPALTNWSCPSVRRSEVRVANGVLYLFLSCVVVLCRLFCVVLSMCMCCVVYVYVLCCLCACVLLSLCLF